MLFKSLYKATLLTLLAVAGAHTCAKNAANGEITLTPPGGPARLMRDFFGMHIHRGDQAADWPSVNFGSWRFWDGAATWPDVQPNAQTWNFQKTDAYVARARSLGIGALITLGRTPQWASSRPLEPSAFGPGQAAEAAKLDDWRAYVRRLATRYAGKVEAYQVWNEANTAPFWTGSVDKLMALTCIAFEEVKRADPKALLVAPSGVGADKRVAWVKTFLAAGGAKCVDVASYHLYTGSNAPESFVTPMLDMRKQMADGGFAAIPLWNTETGYFIPNVTAANPTEGWSPYELRNQIDEKTAADYVVRAMLLARALGFERFYWYAWDDTHLGFIEPGDKKPREQANTLGLFTSLLLRSTLERCIRNATGLWICDLKLANSKPAQVIWVDPKAGDQFQVYAMTAAGSVRNFRQDARRAVAAAEKLAVSSSPLLFVPN